MNQETVILFAEDDFDLRTIVADQLRDAGFVVHEANSATDAYPLALEKKPQIILTDLKMGDTNGIELCEKVHAALGNSGIRYFLMTGATDPDLPKTLKDIGVQTVIKPFDINELIPLLKNALSKN